MRIASLLRRKKPACSIGTLEEFMVDDIPELTDTDFAHAIPRRQRERILRGQIDPGRDIVALRRFTGLTQQQFAKALSISVHTLRN
jgi:DNA-binding transcriptional regulator YiaG